MTYLASCRQIAVLTCMTMTHGFTCQQNIRNLIIRNLNEDLKKVAAWSANNGLLLNSFAMCITSKSKNERLLSSLTAPITINGKNYQWITLEI